MDLIHARMITVSADSQFRDRIETLFPDIKFTIDNVKSFQKFLKKFEASPYDIVIILSSACRDLNEDDLSNTLANLTSRFPQTPILFLTEPEDIDLAINTLKVGTYQYTKLPVSDEELAHLIKTSLEDQSLQGNHLLLKQARREERFENMVGKSSIMHKIYKQIVQAAMSDIPVLLIGETGTGKDLAAQAIHKKSVRQDASYIPVNLGAIPTDLVASELFGHEKGAFTGAHQQQKGKFELADGGTVFLDEIDAIDEKVQVSLLRLIEQKRFHRLGGKKPISVDVRIIAATNTDIEDLIEDERFREDLFYRLDVFRITMPPLRKRHEDIPLLINEFILRFNRTLKKNIAGIAPECVQALGSYNWPGNIRELKNVIQRSMLVCEGTTILPEHLPSRFQTSKSSRRPSVTFEIGTPLDTVEKEMILKALSAANNNRTRAAELLGISRRAIYNKLKKHDIE